MIKHIVLFKFKEGVDKAVDKEVLKEKLKALPSLISTVRSIEIGDNMMDSPRSWDLSLIALFDSVEGLDFYSPHPEHLKVIDYLNEYCEPVSVVDYEL